MSTQPFLTIHVHTLDSRVTRFALNDPQAARHILEQVNPSWLLQHNLVLQDERALSVFPHTAVVRLDLIMEGHLDWPLHSNIVRVTELTEAEFREGSQREENARMQNFPPRSGEFVKAYADITLANADRVFCQYEIKAREVIPADIGMMVQHVSTEPYQYLQRRGGGAILINSAHIMRLNVYPGPPHVPGAWSATLL